MGRPVVRILGMHLPSSDVHFAAFDFYNHYDIRNVPMLPL